MLFCLCLVALLLYDSVFVHAVCSQTFDKAPGKIEAISLYYHHLGHKKCEFVIRAPLDFSISLNFTDIFGFEVAPPGDGVDAAPPCGLPEVQIVEVNVSGSPVVMGKICQLPHSQHAPQVFHSLTHMLRLTYQWLPAHKSGFSLEFTFQHNEALHAPESCEFTCADSSCLPTWSQVCDGVSNCADYSDEHDCPQRLPVPNGRSKSNPVDVSSVQIIIIVIAVVLTIGVLTCVVSHYKMGARSWSDRWNRSSPQQVHQGHHHHLEHNPSTVLYVPPGAQDRLAHEVALFRERQIRLQSVQTDMELDLPPAIGMPDGEEFPFRSLQHLHVRNAEQESEIYRECIRPPPNRTVFEGESPPPYRSSSVGALHPHQGAPPRTRPEGGASPLVMRCHSMSSNNPAAASSGRSTPLAQLRIARLVPRAGAEPPSATPPPDDFGHAPSGASV